MVGVRLVHLPVAPAPDPDLVLTELIAAVDLVAAGFATRVVVSNARGLEGAAAAAALGHAQASGISFALGRDGSGNACAVIGPRTE